MKSFKLKPLLIATLAASLGFVLSTSYADNSSFSAYKKAYKAKIFKQHLPARQVAVIDFNYMSLAEAANKIKPGVMLIIVKGGANLATDTSVIPWKLASNQKIILKNVYLNTTQKADNLVRLFGTSKIGSLVLENVQAKPGLKFDGFKATANKVRLTNTGFTKAQSGDLLTNLLARAGSIDFNTNNTPSVLNAITTAFKVNTGLKTVGATIENLTPQNVVAVKNVLKGLAKSKVSSVKVKVAPRAARILNRSPLLNKALVGALAGKDVNNLSIYYMGSVNKSLLASIAGHPYQKLALKTTSNIPLPVVKEAVKKSRYVFLGQDAPFNQAAIDAASQGAMQSKAKSKRVAFERIDKNVSLASFNNLMNSGVLQRVAVVYCGACDLAINKATKTNAMSSVRFNKGRGVLYGPSASIDKIKSMKNR